MYDQFLTSILVLTLEQNHVAYYQSSFSSAEGQVEKHHDIGIHRCTPRLLGICGLGPILVSNSQWRSTSNTSNICEVDM
jgi:hypothetical protein